jgi:maltooligosyltrehalose trehalohydrolase
MSGQWIDEFHHALHALVTGEVDGYYEDFGETGHLAKALKDSYVYTGQYSVHRKKLFGVLPKDNPYGQFVVFTQNHDQIGNRMLGDRLTTQLSFEGLKLTAAVMLLSPHVPLLFMGEEYGEKNPFQYFISHTDEGLVETVRQGRKAEFAHFKWQGEVPDPQSEETFRQCILSWERIDNDPLAAKLFAYYQYLIAFRKGRTAMQGRQRNAVKVLEIKEDKVIAFERHFKSDRLLIVLNFNKHPVVFSLPYIGKKIFDSAALQWNGPGEINPEDSQSAMLNAESAVIFEMNSKSAGHSILLN